MSTMIDNEKILIFDGACGTNLQAMGLPESTWGSCAGCNEYLNTNAPEAIVELHTSFLQAGANVLETNTLGANEIVLAEYGLADQVQQLNRAAVACAREAIGGREGVYIAASIGPGTRLPSLGQIDVDAIAQAYRKQIDVLLEEGVDLLFIETCQDILHTKTLIVECFRAFERAGKSVPISVSVTLEATGTMLVGTDLAAVAATFEPYGLFSLGLNCATGPVSMASHVHYLSKHWGGRISVIPNAGMPQVIDGQTHYTLSPEDFAASIKTYVEQNGVSVVGGCCGTQPDHIRCLADALKDAQPAPRTPEVIPSLSSGYQAVPIRQEIPPLMIGERTNTSGSKKFRELLLADNFNAALQMAVEQERTGAGALDLCTAYAGRDELVDMTTLTAMFAESVKAPLVIDSTRPNIIEEAIKLYPGRCIINSINLEDGGETLGKMCTIAKRYGAAVIALTIDEDGMAMSPQKKLQVARRICDLAVGKYGLRPADLLFDPLTFTIGSGDENLLTAATDTIEAIRLIKSELPGVHTVLGLSNISFGLPANARVVLNSVFLNEVVEAGMDAAIIHAGKILPLARISDEDREMCLDLIHNRRQPGEQSPLMKLIDHFVGRQDQTTQTQSDDLTKRPEQLLQEKVLNGDQQDLADLLTILMERHDPADIINAHLLPAMQKVGELFGKGEMLLPFVLQSAETMKHSVDILQPFMSHQEAAAGLKVLLATVEGDVHDIGKNLVAIILSNNGCDVHDIGIKVPTQTIIDKAAELDVDVIALSGLLVKSAIVMQDALPRMKKAGLTQPVLLGGAALTPKFVAENCTPQYDSPVVYCKDAFAGLKAIHDHESGSLRSTTFEAHKPHAAARAQVQAVAVGHDNPTPTTPFIGVRHELDINPAEILPYINEQALFRWRWGYKRAHMNEQEYEKLLSDTVRPIFQELVRQTLHEGLIQPKIAYGYFRCHSDGNRLVVDNDGREIVFDFPRQSAGSRLCITDYFKSESAGGDIVGFCLATVGDGVCERIRELYESDRYHDYLVLHGFSVETAEALMEYWHDMIRRQLSIAGKGVRSSDSNVAIVRKYQGQRYGFGYPACPNLEDQRKVFQLLRPEAIGVTLTDSLQMVPEQSTSAIITHHPQAKYFAV